MTPHDISGSLNKMHCTRRVQDMFKALMQLGHKSITAHASSRCKRRLHSNNRAHASRKQQYGGRDSRAGLAAIGSTEREDCDSSGAKRHTSG